MSLFRDLEKRIDQRLRRVFQSEPAPGQGHELVEVQRMILDRIDERVQSLPRARRIFPFNEVSVRIPVPDAEKRAAWEMVFITDDALREDIVEHLRRQEIEYPEEFRLFVSLVETQEIIDPSVVCRNRDPEVPRAAQPVSSAIVSFILPSGVAVEVSRSQIHLGRLADVQDDRRRVVRRNDVVVEGDTVSRAHAHIEFSEGEYRLFDDGSSYGTSATHKGRLIDVPKAGGRGLRLHTGDEIYLGHERVRFEIKPTDG